MFNYIEKIDGEQLGYVQGNIQLPTNKDRIEVTNDEIKNYRFHIKYIDCCTLSESGEVIIDPIKVLSVRLATLSFDVSEKTKQLRSLLSEAGSLGKTEIAQEIAQNIKTINDFLNTDFSNITDIEQIDTITCPELTINYEQHYISKIYGI